MCDNLDDDDPMSSGKIFQYESRDICCKLLDENENFPLLGTNGVQLQFAT